LILQSQLALLKFPEVVITHQKLGVDAINHKKIAALYAAIFDGLY